jgi:hypothetical protein
VDRCIKCEYLLTAFDGESLCNHCLNEITKEGLDVEKEIQRLLKEKR